MKRAHPIWHQPGRSRSEVRRILADSAHPEFVRTAAALLSAITDPDEIRRWIPFPILAGQYPRRIRARVPRGYARAAADLLVAAIRRNLGSKAPPAPAKPDRDPDMVALGRRLRALREKTGLTAQALARRRGVSRQWITAIENGRTSLTVRTLLDTVESAGGTLSIEIQPRPDRPTG